MSQKYKSLICIICNNNIIMNSSNFRRIRRTGKSYICKTCYLKSDVNRTNVSNAAKKLWQSPDYRAKQAATRKIAQPGRSKEIWLRHRDKIIRSVHESGCYDDVEKHSRNSKQLWQNPEFRQKVTESMNKRWADPKFRAKMAVLRAERPQPRFSSIHKIFCGLLDDQHIQYVNKFMIGPWSFDVMIPRIGEKTLLIEINGNWVHSQPDNVRRDKAKHTYYEKYLIEQYELKYVWEHEFYTIDRIKHLIQYWLNKENIPNQFNFEESQFTQATTKEDIQQCEVFLGKYHYLSNIGRSGIILYTKINNQITSVCVFAPPVRKESAINLRPIVLELSRFCINPSYQIKNYGSWLISRYIKLLIQLRPDVSTLIAFADETHNHEGTIYKATNWQHQRIVKPDYWYVDKDGWVMLKKTLWNRASNLRMSEAEYAQKHNYTKVWGKQKHKYVLDLD